MNCSFIVDIYMLDLTGEHLIFHNPESVNFGISLEIDSFLNKCFPKRLVKRILFVVTPDADSNLFNYNTAKRGRYPNYPPYGFGILATHLRKDGIEVKILNLNNEILRACKRESADEFIFDDIWKKALAVELAIYKPDLIGTTCMFTQMHRSLSFVCAEIKKLSPQIPLAVGGVHITNSLVNNESREALFKDLKVEFFFRYECDIAFKQFIKVVNKQAPINSLTQVIFHINNKTLDFPRHNYPTGDDINIIPAHDLMNPIELSRWGKVGSYTYLIPEKAKFSTVLFNRGCRGHCAFCSVRNFNGIGVRSRDVQSVIDELLMLRNNYGVEHIMWLDDDFLYNRSKSMFLFNEMIRQKVDITWDCTNGVIAASLNDEIIEAAEASGCIGLNIGVESGDKEVLRLVKKPSTVEQFLRAAESLRRHPKIFTKVFLIIGFPGETYRQLLNTLEVASEMRLDWYLIQILQPLPNTQIFNKMVNDGLIDASKFETVHVGSGAYGKVAKKSEKGQDLLARDFKDVFNVIDFDTIVPVEKLYDILAYMNYHLNYANIFSENQSQKLNQKLLTLKHIYSVIAPHDAMAMYFAAYLHQKIYGEADPEIINKLKETLDNQYYWKNRFDELGLSVDQLKM